MPLASVMADEPKPIPQDGAPVPKDAIDPELVKLRRPPPKVGFITAAGLVVVAVMFLIRLSPDRRFAGSSATPEPASVADVLAGHVALDSYVKIDAEPEVAQAIRATTSKGSLGLRVVPVRGTGERLWIALSGDGWVEPRLDGYTGRLRRLADLPFSGAVADFAQSHPRPVFAAADKVRAGLASGKVATLDCDDVTLAAGDRVAFEVVDPDAATITCSLNDRLPTPEAWATALSQAGITATPDKAALREEVRFDVATPGAVAALKSKLEAAQLWAARVDPVTHHVETTWGTLQSAAPAGFAQADLVGLYVARDVPTDAYALITDEHPADYWYVTPVTVVLGIIALLFAWAFARAIRRDVWPARA